jgi:hypothetical protein
VFHFSTRALNLAITDTVGYLSGALFDGNLIEGTDKIRVVKEVEKWARDIPSIDNSSSQTNSVFSLQNYPSPFNPETTIEYALTKSGFVSLKVYDMLGREVAELVNERKRAGTYRVDFNGTKLTSGVYLYRLTAGDQIETKRMLLVK